MWGGNGESYSRWEEQQKQRHSGGTLYDIIEEWTISGPFWLEEM